MIDAYDVLGISLDADAEDVKKAYRRLSLQHHPDKVQAVGSTKHCQDANEKFGEIKIARDILQDPDRRKLYDTFGIDLGEERPEMEMWSIGLSTLLCPMGMFTLKTFMMRAVIWMVSFKWIGYLLLLGGVVLAVLYAVDFKYRGVEARSAEAQPVLVVGGIIVAVVIVCWVWQPLADAAGIFYLLSEVIPAALIFESWKAAVGMAVGSLLLALLVRGWWFWIVVLEGSLTVLVLVALTVASGLMGLWLESVKAQHGDKLKESRLRLRRQRKALQDEVAELRRRAQEHEQRSGTSDAVRRPAR